MCDDTKNGKRDAIYQVVAPTLAALSFLAGLVTIIGTLTFNAIPAALQVNPEQAFPKGPWITGTALLLLALITGIWALIILKSLDDIADERARSDAMFTRYLIGIGYFLFVDATVNMVAFAGIASSGKLQQIFPIGDGGWKTEIAKDQTTSWIQQLVSFLVNPRSDERVILCVVLMLAMGMALLGALLYFAKSLWSKFDQKIELFDRNVFWGGLWFRLAEAIVFTIAIFLLLQFKGDDKGIRYLPMIGLFVGLTVKSSEALVFGLARRLLAAVTGFVQGPKDSQPAPPPAPRPNPARPNPQPNPNPTSEADARGGTGPSVPGTPPVIGNSVVS